MTARDALATIRERAEAATEGPWEAADYLVMASDIDIADCQILPDAGFIAHARTDVPALVEALETVLRVADKWERLAEADGEKDPAGWRSHSKAMQIRDAIETALEGQ